MHIFGSVHFDAFEALGNACFADIISILIPFDNCWCENLRSYFHVTGPVTSNPRIDLDLVPDLTPE